MTRLLRSVAALALYGVSAALTAMVLWEALRGGAASDASMILNFDGAAYEDVFGMGFWGTWGLLAIVQAFAVGGGRLAMGGQRLRFVALALLLAFACASGLAYLSFERQHSLWDTHYQ